MSTNYAEIIAQYADAGVTVTDVAQGLAAMEKVSADYPTRCAQTPLIAAAILSKSTTADKIATDAGITSQHIGRYRAAGQILLAHPNLDPRAVVKYANTHTVGTKGECAKVEKMTEDEARKVISGRGNSTHKTDAEKDHEALTRLLGRARKAHESGDEDRIAAMRASLYAIGDALDGVASDAEEVA